MYYPKPKRVRFKPKKKRSRAVQEAVIHRDGRCMWCGRVDSTLVGHHVCSWGSSGIDESNNMITLCGRCHGDVGNGYLDARICNNPELLRRSQMVGFNAKDEQGWKLYEPDKLLGEILEEIVNGQASRS